MSIPSEALQLPQKDVQMPEGTLSVPTESVVQVEGSKPAESEQLSLLSSLHSPLISLATARPVPEGFIVHSESTTSILFAAPPESASPSTAPVFLNPVQEYNRDLSVVAIRTWGDIWSREKKARWEEGVRRKWEKKKRGPPGGVEGGEGKGKGQGQGKKRKGAEGEAVATEGLGESPEKKVDEGAKEPAEVAPPVAGSSTEPPAEAERPFTPKPPTYKFTLLEALSATGLRAIRYAKELPLLKYVVANDLSASAVLDIKRNIEFNGLAPGGLSSLPGWEEEDKEEGVKPGSRWSKAVIEEAKEGRVRVNEGDACVYMYQHRAEDQRFDCIDLDPYGSAVPFLDAAMNAIQDGDMGVLAGHNYPEKAFSAYGGICVNAEYSHEVALRLVLHSLATTAARYGRYIEPQLSLSIDFYVRLFIRVRTGPKEVKALASKTSLVYCCHSCQSPHFQPLGRVSEKVNEKNGSVNYTYHIPAGPPEEVKGDRCGECGGKFHIAGPMWSATIHNKEFVGEMLEHVRENEKDFKTQERIKGMLAVALAETEAPLYFSPAKIASLFHSTCPPLHTVASALLNASYTLSRSHAVAGSIKTDAPRKFVHDIMREWIKSNPVKMGNVREGSPVAKMLAGEQTYEVSLAPHPKVHEALLDNVKIVRYQINPQANWGPARAAVRGAAPGQGGLQGEHPHHEYHPRTVQRIVTRIQALTLELLPLEVDLDDLTSPTSSILTLEVIDAYSTIAGDFHQCLPFALLEARRYFREQMKLNPSDADENEGRKLACEALARKLVARAEMREQYGLLSKRWTTVDEDGDETLPLSALESAVDQHATFFLSSNEAQRCVFALWKGLLVQRFKEGGNVEYEIYKVKAGEGGFLGHWTPDRIGVPRYQFFFRIALWILFLFCYTFAIQTPERGFGIEDSILYIQLLGYLVEDLVRIWKIGVFAATGFWQLVNWCIYIISLVAFVYRCMDLHTDDPEKQSQYRMQAFQWLSSAAPLIWAKLLTVFDLYRFFGVLQIVVWRMLKESAVFFVLLSLLGVGFGQALTGLDVADQKRDSTRAIFNYLLQALLGSPNFDFFDEDSSGYPFGLVLYYAWSIATLVILLNVLVALFSTSYDQCVGESEPTFLAFFAGKTIASVRAPDQFVYPAPFNLIELFILPLEFFLSAEAYASVNRWLMGGLFFLPISAVALWDTHVDPLRSSDLDDLIKERDDYQGPEENPEPYRASSSSPSQTSRSSQASASGEGEFGHPGEPEGMQISRVSFKELKAKMPDLKQSTEGKTLAIVLELSREIKALRDEVAALREDKLEKAGEIEEKKVGKQEKKVDAETDGAEGLAD
ncbi:hypothetical protein JCM11641_004418 [Rhodosporidiobolus odoratus]